jgi:hypothetical protein
LPVPASLQLFLPAWPLHGLCPASALLFKCSLKISMKSLKLFRRYTLARKFYKIKVMKNVKKIGPYFVNFFDNLT